MYFKSLIWREKKIIPSALVTEHRAESIMNSLYALAESH